MIMQMVFGEFNYGQAKAYCASIEGFSVKLAIVYVVSIFSVKFYMKDRKAYDLQLPLNIWNAILSVFSGLGFFYTFTTFLNIAYNKGTSQIHTTISEVYTDKTCGYWVFLWVLSKIPELVDTYFIVLRKRPLMFMHWYHHALTGYYAIVNYSEENAHMFWLVWTNYGIHAAMYGYYFLRSLKVNVPPQVAQTITTLQMVQFSIAIAAQLHVGILAISTTGSYPVTFRGWFIGMFMLITYFALWIRFYNISYYSKGGKKYVAHMNGNTKKRN
uniref:Elongation of very long chain fatty acids protein n=1 Tax=Angiostrongylus cantonensis TaxID=6313 RepID=A0A0K0DD17_ANGCA